MAPSSRLLADAGPEIHSFSVPISSPLTVEYCVDATRRQYHVAWTHSSSCRLPLAAMSKNTSEAHPLPASFHAGSRSQHPQSIASMGLERIRLGGCDVNCLSRSYLWTGLRAPFDSHGARPRGTTRCTTLSKLFMSCYQPLECLTSSLALWCNSTYELIRSCVDGNGIIVLCLITMPFS